MRRRKRQEEPESTGKPRGGPGRESEPDDAGRDPDSDPRSRAGEPSAEHEPPRQLYDLETDTADHALRERYELERSADYDEPAGGDVPGEYAEPVAGHSEPSEDHDPLEQDAVGEARELAEHGEPGTYDDRPPYDEVGDYADSAGYAGMTDYGPAGYDEGAEPVPETEDDDYDEWADYDDRAASEQPGTDAEPRGAEAAPLLEVMDGAYGQLRDALQRVVDDAEGIRANARREARDIVDRAETDGAQRAEQLSAEAELLRSEAEEYARDIRLAVDAYATGQRREAEGWARDAVKTAEQEAEATRAAAEKMATEVERTAARRNEELRSESRLLEERRARTREVLSDLASQLKDVPLDVPDLSRTATPEDNGESRERRNVSPARRRRRR